MRAHRLLILGLLTFALDAGCGSTMNNASGNGGSGGSAGTTGAAAGGRGTAGATGASGGHGGSAATGGSTGAGGSTGGGTAGGGGSAGSDGGQTTCSPACGAGSICVASGTEGGVIRFPNDAGMCAPGTHLSGSVCVNDLSYACKPIPSGCGGTVTCACAASTLCPSGYSCQGPTGGVLACIQQVP